MRDARTIVSVHIPKTAGWSFRTGLLSAFGERLLLDYSDRPLDGALSARWRRLRKRLALSMTGVGGVERFVASYDAIHGHFIASKYSALGERGALCAFFRDPAERAISQASYWRRNPDPENAMWREFDAKTMTSAQLAATPRQRRIYALFTGGIPLERFAFIGITEEYETSLRLFNEMFGVNVMHRKVNVGDRTEVDKREREAITSAQRENYLIYDRARRRFDVLCHRYLDA